MSKVVYLSPSTQENNIGYGNYGTEESRMNQVADFTEKVLKEHGLTVYRNKPSMSLGEVVKESNSKRPNVHVAIHSNAANGKARGCEAFCHRFGGEAEKLTRQIYNEIMTIAPTTGRGVKEGYNHYGVGKPLYETAYTAVPCCLVEVAFHDNREDAEWIVNNIENIGIAIAKGILKYFNIAYQSENDELKSALEFFNQNHAGIDAEYWYKRAKEVSWLDVCFIKIYNAWKQGK